MRKNYRIWFAFYTMLLPLVFARGAEAGPIQLEDLLKGPAMPTEVVLGKAKEQISEVIDQAASEADYALLNAAMEARILLDTLDSLIVKQQRLAGEVATGVIRVAFQEIDQSIVKAREEVQTLWDTGMIDVSRLMNRIPGLGRELPLRRVEGAHLFATKTARVRLIGAAFDAESKVEVEIDGRSLEASAIDRTRPNELVLALPPSQLSNRFQNDRVVEIPMKVATWKMREHSWLGRLWPPNWGSSGFRSDEWSYDLQLRLLPKIAVRGYRLVGHVAAEIPREVAWTEWSREVTVRKAGRDCKRHESCANEKLVCVALPSRAQVVLGGNQRPDVKRSKRGCGRFCAWTNHPYVTGGKVCQTFKNFRKSRDAKVRLRASYQPLEPGTQPIDIRLRSLQSQAEVEALEFGKIYEALLPPGHKTYSLSLELFNGDTIDLIPGMEEVGALARVVARTENLGEHGSKLNLRLAAP